MGNTRFLNVDIVNPVVIGVAVVVMVLVLLVYAKVISRSGYSGWWVLVALVPVLNLVMLLMFAFKEWPVERELRELRTWANYVQAQQHGGPYPGEAFPGPQYPPAQYPPYQPPSAD